MAGFPLFLISGLSYAWWKVQPKISKFAIFYVYKQTPWLIFPILIYTTCYIIFIPNECPGLFWQRLGHTIRDKNKVVAWNEKWKNATLGFGTWQLAKY